MSTADQFATSIRRLYQAFQEVGFTEIDAFKLTQAYLRGASSTVMITGDTIGEEEL